MTKENIEIVEQKKQELLKIEKELNSLKEKITKLEKNNLKK